MLMYCRSVLVRCSVCWSWYCGPGCQERDWPLHRQSCIPPPPLLDPCNVSEIEETDDSLVQESKETQKVSTEGILNTVESEANIFSVKKLQEYENKLEFLEECLKEKKESLELITSVYIKVVHDMKQVSQLQDLKIFKYESDIKILEEEAKMENRIKGIKEGQLEWAERELKRHNTENVILQKRTNDHAVTVKTNHKRCW